MKRYISAIAAIFIMTLTFQVASAQPNQGNNGWEDRWKAAKVGFLTDYIGLTSAEAEKFWPIYNKAEQERQNNVKAMFDAYEALENAIKAGKSDKEIKSLLNDYVAAQQADRSLEAKYIAEYRRILSETKVAKIYLGEEQFRRSQINRLHRPYGGSSGSSNSGNRNSH